MRNYLPINAVLPAFLQSKLGTALASALPLFPDSVWESSDHNKMATGLAWPGFVSEAWAALRGFVFFL